MQQDNKAVRDRGLCASIPFLFLTLEGWHDRRSRLQSRYSGMDVKSREADMEVIFSAGMCTVIDSEKVAVNKEVLQSLGIPDFGAIKRIKERGNKKCL